MQKVTFTLPQDTWVYLSFQAIGYKATKLSPRVFISGQVRSASLACPSHRCTTAQAGSICMLFFGFCTDKHLLRRPQQLVKTTFHIDFQERLKVESEVSILFWEESYALRARTALTWTSVFNQLKQFGVDGLISLPKHRDEVIYLLNIVRSKECVCCACFGTAGSSSNSVDIVLWGVRVVIIDDKFHIFHICKVLQCGKKRGTKFCTPQQPNRR